MPSTASCGSRICSHEGIEGLWGRPARNSSGMPPAPHRAISGWLVAVLRGERPGKTFGDQIITDYQMDLAQGKALAWFQARMEFGPRALGNRSILGDPRSPTMQKMLNGDQVPRVVPTVRAVGPVRACE